jgi:hypothetical protein
VVTEEGHKVTEERLKQWKEQEKSDQISSLHHITSLHITETPKMEKTIKAIRVRGWREQIFSPRYNKIKNKKKKRCRNWTPGGSGRKVCVEVGNSNQIRLPAPLGRSPP